jgi:hypothetical protein
LCGHFLNKQAALAGGRPPPPTCLDRNPPHIRRLPGKTQFFKVLSRLRRAYAVVDPVALATAILALGVVAPPVTVADAHAESSRIFVGRPLRSFAKRNRLRCACVLEKIGWGSQNGHNGPSSSKAGTRNRSGANIGSVHTGHASTWGEGCESCSEEARTDKRPHRPPSFSQADRT